MDGNLKLVLPEGIPSAAQAGTPSIRLTVGPTGIPSAATVGTPAISVGTPPENGHKMDTEPKIEEG